jgi:hypothetical protein
MTESKYLKQTIRTGVTMALALVASACSDSSSATQAQQIQTVMELNKLYTVNEGDTLVNDENAKVEVTHLVSSNVKQVKIISGSATLLSGNFSVN